jgi:gamma-glutamylaminecyclotransferase
MKTKVFVYGTLKRGGIYHHYISKEDRFLSTAITKKNYRLFACKECPFLIEQDDKNSYQVHGEIFEVSNDTLLKLDELEEVPDIYYKKDIDVLDSNGNELKILTYFYHPNLLTSQDWEVTTGNYLVN